MANGRVIVHILHRCFQRAVLYSIYLPTDAGIVEKDPLAQLKKFIRHCFSRNRQERVPQPNRSPIGSSQMGWLMEGQSRRSGVAVCQISHAILAEILRALFSQIRNPLPRLFYLPMSNMMNVMFSDDGWVFNSE